MKKVSKYFVVSVIFPIFAPAILEKTGGNALFDILHDRLTSFEILVSTIFLNFLCIFRICSYFCGVFI